MIHNSRLSDIAVRASLRARSKFWLRMSPTVLLSGLIVIVAIPPAAASGWPQPSSLKPNTHYCTDYACFGGTGESKAKLHAKDVEYAKTITSAQSVVKELKSPWISQENLWILDH
jgi:hypothetical protein